MKQQEPQLEQEAIKPAEAIADADEVDTGGDTNPTNPMPPSDLVTPGQEVIEICKEGIRLASSKFDVLQLANAVATIITIPEVKQYLNIKQTKPNEKMKGSYLG